MRKRKLLLCYTYVIFAIALLLSVIFFCGSFSFKKANAEEPVVFEDGLLVDFDLADNLTDVVYSSQGLSITDYNFYQEGTPAVKYSALTTSVGSTTGNAIFSFKAKSGKMFSSLILSLYARTYNSNISDTSEKIAVYIGDTTSNFVKVKSICDNNNNATQYNDIDLAKYVNDKDSFFVKVEITNSTSNTEFVTLKEIDFDIAFECVEVTFNLSDVEHKVSKDVVMYVDKGERAIDAIVSLPLNFERTDTLLYKEDGTTVVGEDEIITEPTTYCINGEWYKYSIKYELNGGSNSANNLDHYYSSVGLKLNDAGKSGYKFAGWFLDDEFTIPIFEILTGQEGDLTLHAKWTPDIPIAIKVDPVEVKTGCKSGITSTTLAVSLATLVFAGVVVSVRLLKKKGNKGE